MRFRLPTTWGMLGVFLALALMRGLLYVALVPPWQHYDEPGHLQYAEYLARHRRVPGSNNLDIELRQEIIASMQQHRFATYQPAWHPPTDKMPITSRHAVPMTQFRHPLLYYLLGAAVISALPTPSVEVHLYALRMLSVGLNLLLLTTAAATLRLVFPERREIVHSALAFIVFLPAYSDIATAVNNDVLANLLFTVLVYLLVRQLVIGFSWQLGLATFGVLGLGLVTKRTTVVGLVPLLAVALLLSRRRGRKYFWAMVGILVGIGLLVGIAVFEWQPGQGLVLSPRITRYLLTASLPRFLRSVFNWERSWPVYQTVLSLIFRGFWGHFSWGTEALTDMAYYALLLVALVALAGVIRLLLGIRSASLSLNHRQRQVLWVMLLTLLVVWVAALLRVHPIRETGPTYLPRARYTYVAILPAALLFAAGLWSWMPTRWRRWLPVGVMAIGIWLDTWFLTGYLIPFYLG